MLGKLKRILIGRPMKSAELEAEKLGKLKALAILSSDALSSVAYGTEQILIVLMVAGFAALWYSVPISLAVLGLLVILVISYRQTIFAYPTGGGAYIVAKDNLGQIPSLIAGGSLLVDYVLTVAVSSSAGTDAITSAFPVLHDHRVLIALIMIVFLTIMNLRGVTESASVLAIPIYLFVVAIFFLIISGVIKYMTGGIEAAAPEFGATVSNVSLFLLLKAFSSGCSALTGVEAVSNAIPNFRQPAERNAAATLLMMGIILGSMFIGITLLAYWYGVSPRPTETIISQIARMTFGSGVIYFIIQGVTALILFLAANTAYSAFPLLSFMLAKDKYMPHMFMVRGDRLGFSNGIIFLSLASALLVIVFHGETDNLIPLYAVGVFIPFTLSQLGMMIRWIKLRPANWGIKLLINTIGMLTTLSITLIFIFTKFSQIWIIFIFLPIVVYLFHKIYVHYQNTAEQLRIDLDQDKPQPKGNTIIIPVAGITRVVMNTISYAQTLSPNVVAVYVGFDEEAIEKMEKKWEQWNPGVRLIILRSRYRSILGPLRRFIDTVEWKNGETDHITILIPQFVTKHWWESILHNQTSLLMRAYLINYKDVVVATVPFHLKN
ncbi:APC family permease [Paenibacillus hunanensis]|uniref:Amino acid transporter n=1 Tax=Paenibacillus hunanensis TaxID=539262 RepID=A0ABU1IUD2_9BACL|nr:APC family permease [Paenibacillus hunanensis]MCL9661377.1 APC family permease [Paenibacillus hunanensis]MDR6242860.1 amino acid transporter [Paenibacillus hunanensis]WPP41785.1 APC family permease [Paenibacillus hunanensis]GGJ03278.1 amino acid permease [Paenibacillus hunanensis]